MKPCDPGMTGLIFFIFFMPLVCADNGVVPVRVEVGKALEVEVENGVADLVRSGDPMTLKVEHTSGHVFVTPLTETAAELTVIDVRGRSYRLKYVFGQGAQAKVMIMDAENIRRDAVQGDAAISFMRDLLRGTSPAQADVKESHAVMFDNGVVRLRARTIQDLPQMVGYIMDAENLKAYPVIVPVQQIMFFGLLAISAQKDVLEPWEKTEVYMVVRK